MGYLTGAMTGPDDDLDFDPQVEVFATSSAPEAEVVRGLLHAAGIPAAIRGETQGPYRMGGSHVWVPEELEERARAVIEEARRDGDAAADEAAVDVVEAEGRPE
jgi:Putative prokaryotic signal transducing protein